MKKSLILLDPAGGDGGGTPAPAAPAAPAAPPAGFISQADSNAAIEKARTQEKDKLYPEIERLTNLNKTNEGIVAGLKAEMLALQGKLDAIKLAAPDGKQVDVPALIADVAKRTEEAMRSTYEPRLQALDSSVRETNGRLRTAELDKYRVLKIAEAGGENALIPSLIRGNTEAEIDASIADSKATFDGIKQRISGGAPSPTPQPNNGNGNRPAVTPPPALPVSTPPAGGPSTPTVREMPMSQFKLERANLKAAAAQRYAQQPA